MEGKSIRPKNASLNIRRYNRSLSGRRSARFSEQAPDRTIALLERQAIAIDELITEFNVPPEFYTRLIKILEWE